MFTQTANRRQLSAMLTSSRCLLGIMKMCSSATLALCAAWPGPVRLKPSDPEEILNRGITESPPSSAFCRLVESRGASARFSAIRPTLTGPDGPAMQRASESDRDLVIDRARDTLTRPPPTDQKQLEPHRMRSLRTPRRCRNERRSAKRPGVWGGRRPESESHRD